MTSVAWSTDEIRVLREMAVKGQGCEEIALALRRKQSDVRDMAELLGVSLETLECLEWCVKCCSPRSRIDPATGWCEPCTTRWRVEQQRIADDEEEERLMEEAAREVNVLKKQRQRMRETYGANPRKGKQDQ